MPRVVEETSRWRTTRRINSILAAHCRQPCAKVERDTHRDTFVTAAEAREYGIVDRVLTNDRIPVPLKEQLRSRDGMTMTQQPEIDDVRRHVLSILRNSPIGASTRFSLAEDLIDRYPSLDRDGARSLIHRALVALQDAHEVVVLRPESWDCSGDERVRLAQG